MHSEQMDYDGGQGRQGERAKCSDAHDLVGIMHRLIHQAWEGIIMAGPTWKPPRPPVEMERSINTYKGDGSLGVGGSGI